MFAAICRTFKRGTKKYSKDHKGKYMKLAIMQPYLFPYVGYWQLVNAVDTFVIYDDVNFIKRGYINKNSILVNNEPKSFTLELSKASQNKLINEIEVGSNSGKILNIIEQNYSKAPYFNIVYPIFEEILLQDEKNLAKFVGFSIESISEYLKISTKFIYSSNIDKDNNLRGQEKILEIAKKLEATNYINAIGGKELYNKDAFQKERIKLNFLETEQFEYQQFKNEFIPNLSIVDIMMFNSVEETQTILSRYKLV